MAVFPTLSSGTVCFFPVTESITYNTGLARFLDDKEQRFRKQPKLARLTITWNNLNAADYALVLATFDAAKGGFDTSLSIALGSTTYSNLCFVDDQLIAVEAKPKYWSVTATFRQVHA